MIMFLKSSTKLIVLLIQESNEYNNNKLELIKNNVKFIF